MVIQYLTQQERGIFEFGTFGGFFSANIWQSDSCQNKKVYIYNYVQRRPTNVQRLLQRTLLLTIFFEMMKQKYFPWQYHACCLMFVFKKDKCCGMFDHLCRSGTGFNMIPAGVSYVLSLSISSTQRFLAFFLWLAVTPCRELSIVSLLSLSFSVTHTHTKNPTACTLVQTDITFRVETPNVRWERATRV